MKQPIPNYSIDIFENVEDVFFLYHQIDAQVAIDQPFRRTYYAVGICVGGTAELKVNLETYTIGPRCVITKPPHVIHQWTGRSEDFKTLTVFFTKNFITTNNTLPLEQLAFLSAEAQHVFAATPAQAAQITATLALIYQKYQMESTSRKDVLRNHISSLLYEIAAVYDDKLATRQTATSRGQYLVSSFKQLVNRHFLKEKRVEFYAEQLSITPKYLTEILKNETGKTASQWIGEALIIEAKVLLHNPALSIAQVADLLHFPNQSTFGRFFKRSTHLSPTAYKNA